VIKSKPSTWTAQMGPGRLRLGWNGGHKGSRPHWTIWPRWCMTSSEPSHAAADGAGERNISKATRPSQGNSQRPVPFLRVCSQADAAGFDRSCAASESGQTDFAGAASARFRARVDGTIDEQSLDLSAVLEELQVLDATGVRALELRYFLGCTGEETAALLGLSASTVDRSLRFSLAWLHSRLHPKT
jgi:hypothetical protein